MAQPYYVSNFNSRLVSLLIRQCFGATFPAIEQKQQFHYIFNYLETLGAQTVVCETEYVDRDYLEDYSNYYVKCFGQYPTRCARLHFFNKEFTYDDLRAVLSGTPSQLTKGDLQSSYLGFSVVKPLPKTFIGRTCLKVCDDLSPPQRKVIAKEYSANLFGIELAVKSIAFQEQDRTLSACATTALWSLFHALEDENIRHIPSPSDITSAAVSDSNLSVNRFPNNGLAPPQIERAIDSFSLKSHQVHIESNDEGALYDFHSTVKTYLDSRIPLLLGLSVYDADSPPYEHKGAHAVTVLGYEEAEGKLSAIYIHDDRIGPYVKAKICSESTLATISETELKDTKLIFSIKVTEAESDNGRLSEFVVPYTLIAATCHKVRIPPKIIIQTCEDFKSVMDRHIQSKVAELREPGAEESLVQRWDIRLDISSRKKREYLERDITNRFFISTNHWPRHIWVCQYIIGEENGFDLIFDATEIIQGNALVCAVVFDEDFYEGFAHIVKQELDNLLSEGLGNENLLKQTSESFFMQTVPALQQAHKIRTTFLDEHFGEARPPQRIDVQDLAPSGPNRQDSVIELNSSLEGATLCDVFDKLGTPRKLIWVISEYGSVLIGKDKAPGGHPTLTASEPARVGGEIIRYEDNVESPPIERYVVNHFSGRYSAHFSPEQKRKYLDSAVHKLKEIFSQDIDRISYDINCWLPREQQVKQDEETQEKGSSH